MKKLNKKGFTLIEMLVVIAIIAILVAVIVPTVSSATNKAKAATDAANLRSALAEATIKCLDTKVTATTDFSADDLKIPAASKLNDADTFDCVITAEGDAGFTVNVYYGNHGINYYASIASGDSATDTSADRTSAS